MTIDGPSGMKQFIHPYSKPGPVRPLERPDAIKLPKLAKPLLRMRKLSRRRMNAFSQFFYQFAIECFQVFRAATRNDAIINHNFFVFPDNTCIDEVSFNRMIRGHLATGYHSCFNQQLRTMTDGC